MIHKKAFTMIELVFVIVILSILAIIAVPKLTATRNDAKATAEVQSAAIALHNLASEFMATGSFLNYSITNANNAVNCFLFTLNNINEGNITLSTIDSASNECSTIVLNKVREIAENNDLLDSNGSAKVYVFGATGIKR